MTSRLFLTAAMAGLLVMVAATALADQGPCLGGFWPDGSGCCPLIIRGSPYYRDSNNQCYPREINHSIYYADSNGYHYFFCHEVSG
jgi:hypothetical protein